MFDMSNDSHLFYTYSQLVDKGAKLEGNKFLLNNQFYVPLYEGKMIWHYNHHFGTINEGTKEKPARQMAMPTSDELKNPNHNIMPWYWIPKEDMDNRLIKTDAKGNIIWEWSHKWLIGFRDITNATHDRTFVISLIPDACGVGNSATLLFVERGTMPERCFWE